jgi:ribonuclease BN (tRNA processing enzyme)
MRSKLLLFLSCLFAAPAVFGDSAHCGDEGIWIEILGAGSGELSDGQGPPSFLIWQDNVARLLIDTGSGSSVGFDRSGADINDIEVIALTQLHADNSVDLPAYLAGALAAERSSTLTVLGPDSNTDEFVDTETFVQRLIGNQGAFPHLSGLLRPSAPDGFRVKVSNVPAIGSRKWSRYRSPNVRLMAVPVQHGNVPTIAWRVEIGGQAAVFAGDFNNDKNIIGTFAADADALVASHAIPEVSRGALRDAFALPSELGKVAAAANARMLILAHRTNRTRGRESLSRAAIEDSYGGSVLFANDGECWGL